MASTGPTPPPSEMPIPNVPLIHRPGEADAPATLPRPPLAVRRRVLVVDDQGPVLKMLVRVLAVDNYDVQSSDSALEVVRLLDTPGFPGIDLLITDLMMPKMNGRELATLVRQRYPSVRVLYVTGFADTLFKGVKELGDGESFIEKPFGAEGLLEAVRLLMFGHIAAGEVPADKRDSAGEFADNRLRARIVRLLKRLRFA